MGFGGISIWQLLIVLLIVVMVFGTKKLRSIGSDLGSAVNSFKKSLSSEDSLLDKECAANQNNIESDKKNSE